jgi:hypothetical protein
MEQATADVARMNAIWLSTWPAPPGLEKERFAKAPALRSLKEDVVGDIGNVLCSPWSSPWFACWIAPVAPGTTRIISSASPSLAGWSGS